MHRLTEKIEFPDLNQATNEGLLALGGDLSVARLIKAYKSGIFPWYEAPSPILWWAPNPRFVLFPQKLKVSKSMRLLLRKKVFKVTVNKDFKAVISSCSKINRQGQSGTWISKQMEAAYIKLYELGFAKSIEVWRNDQLVGGLYGVDLGNGMFCGESMFAKESNASKVGFITFVHQTNYRLIDCQVHTKHLESLGAETISRDEFLNYL